MKPLRVLMLVADPERRHDLSTLLRRASHQVETIPDAAAASDSLRDPVADTLVLDLTSPDLDLTALRRAISPAEAIEPESLDAAERQHLARVLRFTDGNKRKAALLLGISRSTLLNKVRKYALLIGGACLLPMVAPPLACQEPSPIPAGRLTSGTLSFDGHASVGDFVGRTSTVSGEITGGADLSAVRGWVQAPVKTLTTENGRRDKDLNKSMESDKYPDIRFELSGITRRAGSDTIRVTLLGKLLIHGVTKPVSLPATLHFNGSKARVRSDFPLSLKEYGIGGLSKMLGVLKMYDDIEVHVDLLFGLASPPS